VDASGDLNPEVSLSFVLIYRAVARDILPVKGTELHLRACQSRERPDFRRVAPLSQIQELRRCCIRCNTTVPFLCRFSQGLPLRLGERLRSTSVGPIDLSAGDRTLHHAATCRISVHQNTP
jgi:hypothetical protein